MAGKIYLISCHDKPVYVGFTTKTLAERWHGHIEEVQGTRTKSILHKAIRKYGVKSFTIELIADYINEDFALNVCEEFWIRHLQTHTENGGYNMTWGGDKPPSPKGKKRSIEHCLNLSKAQTGKKYNAIAREKMALAKLGKPWSEARRKAYNNRFGGN